MPFARDPLSERYDRAAAALVATARATPGRWAKTMIARPRGRSRVLHLIREAGLELESVDAGGLTPWERAFQRAAYYVFRNRHLDDAWGMQRAWGPRSAAGRMFAVRLSPRDVAYRAAARKPARERYTANPAARSQWDRQEGQ
jgi:hypothetical protein